MKNSTAPLCVLSGLVGAAIAVILGMAPANQPADPEFLAKAKAALEVDEMAKTANRDAIKSLTDVPMPVAVAMPKGSLMFVVSANGSGWLVDDSGVAHDVQYLSHAKDAPLCMIDFRAGHVTMPLPLPSPQKPK